MRFSTFDQNLVQKKRLEEFGCDRIFSEKTNGPKRNRQELARMLEFLRPEDTVVVTDLTQLSNSIKDLVETMELISQKGAKLKSLNETWIDTTAEYGKIFSTVLANIAQFERDLTTEQNKAGIQAVNRIKNKRKEIVSSISGLSIEKQRQVTKQLDELLTLTYEAIFRN